MGREAGKVVEIKKAREEKQENLRREYERVLFNRVLGCYTVIEKLGLKAAELLDISKSGCAFRMPYEDGAFKDGEEVDFRLYFSNNAYLPTRLTVKRVSKVFDQGRQWWQYGCVFDTSLSTHGAIESFVDFIGAFAQVAREDKGEPQKWFL